MRELQMHEDNLELLWDERDDMVTTFFEYEEMVMQRSFYPGALIYPALGLAGEAGEVVEKVKKLLRDDQLPADCDDAITTLTVEQRKSIAMEIGDVLFYVTAIATDLGYDLDEIATMNAEKLRDREERGVLHGSGDNR